MKPKPVLFALTLLLFIVLPGILSAQVIQVASGVDALSTAFASAPAGSILELTDAGGQYIEQTDIIIDKDITIRAKAGLAQKPILYGIGATVLFQSNGRLTVEGIHFEGLIQGNQSPAYFIEMKADSILTSTQFSLFVDNCEFYNGAQRAIYTSDGTFHPLDTLSMTNSVFYNMAKQAIYEKGTRNTPEIMVQPGGCRYLKFENCLIYKSTSSGDGMASYIEPANRDSASFTYPVVFINHLTVDSMSAAGINTYTTPNATIQNCIVVNMKDTTKYAYGAETGRFAGAPKSHIINCLWANARFVTYGSSAFAQYPDTVNIINALPVFTDPDNMDFSLAPGSPGKNAATDGLDLGYIPGGLTPPAQVIEVASGVDALSTAFASAPAGSILELTDAGGQYIEQTDIIIDKDITIRAKAGLAQKPILYGIGATVLFQSNGRLTVEGIHFEGLIQGNQSPAYFIEMKADSILTSTQFSLFVDNCEFYNGAQRAIYTSDGTFHPLDTLSVTNSVFYNMAKQAIYEKSTHHNSGMNVQPGGCRYLKFENCLVYKSTTSGDGHATYIEPADRDSANYTWPKVFINHITVDSMSSGGIFTYTTPGCVTQNCIVVNMKDTTKYAFNAETGRFVGAPPSSIKNCLWANARFVTYGSSEYAQYPDTANIINDLPVFTDPANMDFSLAPGSPGKNAATDGLDLGYIAGGLPTAIKQVPNPLPEKFQLSQNYPNPFNPATMIDFALPKSGQYSLKVYNILGQLVATLFNETVTPGSYSVKFDASGLASGMYIYQLRGNNVVMTKSMMLLK